MACRLEFIEGASAKFWEITIDGNSTTVTWVNKVIKFNNLRNIFFCTDFFTIKLLTFFFSFYAILFQHTNYYINLKHQMFHYIGFYTSFFYHNGFVLLIPKYHYSQFIIAMVKLVLVELHKLKSIRMMQLRWNF